MKNVFSASFLLLLLLFGVAGCSDSKKKENYSDVEISATSKELDGYLEQEFHRDLANSPILQTRLGYKIDYGSWDNFLHLRLAKQQENNQKRLAYLKDSVEVAALNTQALLKYRLYKQQLENKIKFYNFRFYNYPLNQVNGVQVEIPSFLIHMHQIENSFDAAAYISRLQKIPQVFRQVLKGVQLREFNGIIPPQFMYDETIETCRNILRGKPFEDSREASVLLADFQDKIDSLKFSLEEKEELLMQAKTALNDSVKPAYENLIIALQDQRKRATTEAGVSKFPKGDEYYQQLLKRISADEISVEELHELGLKAVSRIQSEMETEKSKLDFEGNLKDFFDHMSSEEKFYFEPTEKGKQKYLQQSKNVVQQAKSSFKNSFSSMPKSDLQVKAIAGFREKSAPQVIYDPPAINGKRPGTYFINLFDMSSMPNFEIQALAYAEGIPGEHLQMALIRENDSLSLYQKTDYFPAFVEGWKLYSLRLAQENGYFKDAYSNFGRLSIELSAAIGLVVDTGIHEQNWSREEAIAYMLDSSDILENQAVKRVEEQIVLPGKAVAAILGMHKFLSLRQKAKDNLGKAFDSKEFHEVLLSQGALPLNLLEEHVNNWIKTKNIGHK